MVEGIAFFDALPDQLVGRILTLAAAADNHTYSRIFPRVCKRWRRLFYAEPALWRRLCVLGRPLSHMRPERRLSWLASMHSTLSKVGPLVEELYVSRCEELAQAAEQTGGVDDCFSIDSDFSVDDDLGLDEFSIVNDLGVDGLSVNGGSGSRVDGSGGGGSSADGGGGGGGDGTQLADWLSCLSGSTLRQLQLDTGNQGVRELPVSALRQLSRLTSLEHLNLQYPQPSTAVADALFSLPQLRSLEVRAKGWWRPQHVSGLSRLQQLSRLEWDSHLAAIPQRMVDALLRLPLLADLRLCSQQLPAAVASLSALTQLSHLELEERHTSATGDLALPAPAGFPHLCSFRYESWRGRRMFLVAGSQVDECWQRSRGSTPLTASLPRSLQSLPQLLPALLPPGRLPLRQLHVKCGRQAAELGQVPPSPHLATLTELQLSAPAEHMDSLLNSFLELSPHVNSLSLGLANDIGKFTRLHHLPPCLVNRAGLRKLSLMVYLKSELPIGTYLSELEELDVEYGQLARVPAALAAATKLRRLSLYNNQDLAVSQRDADEILLALPQLAWLNLKCTQRTRQGVIDYMRSRRPELEILA